MSNFPSVKAKDFVRVIKKLGFYLDRQKGSHAIYKDSKGRRVVVPIHSRKDLKPGTLRGMIQDSISIKKLFLSYYKSRSSLKILTERDRLFLESKVVRSLVWRSH